MGKPITFALTGGERSEAEALPALLGTGAVKRLGPGRPRLRPERVAGDRGYSSRAVRQDLRRRRIGAVIPQPRNQRPCALMDRAAYRRRNVVERLINRLKQHRRIATRYEKLAANYLAMLTLAAIRLWL
jgi:transposase